MSDCEQTKGPSDPDRWYIPPLVLFEKWPLMLGFIAWATSFIFLEVRRGNPTFVTIPFIIGILGVVLLFFARLPLYKKRIFFSFGPARLDQYHRKLYRRAYSILVLSIIIDLFMLAGLKN
jgi:hypothetical protein